MAAPYVLVVLVVGQAPQRADDAAVAAATQALPTGSSVVVRSLPAVPPDAEVLRIESREAARAVAVISWDGEARRVRVRLHRAEEPRFYERSILFEAADAPPEQGRTVGFTLASMIPEASPALALVPPRSDGPAERAPPATSAVVPAPAKKVTDASRDDSERPTAGEEPGDGSAGKSARWPRAYLDGAVLAAAGIGGFAGGFGARAALGWLASPRVALRLDGTVRIGDVPPASVTALTASAGPGLAVDLVSARAEQPLGVSMRVHALAIFLRHSHLSDEPEPVHMSRWMPGASAFVEGSLRISGGAAVFLAAGSEVAFGHTDVYLRGVRVASVPPARGLAEAGIRVRF